MDVKQTLSLLASEDRNHLAVAARDLGRELAAVGAKALASFRRQLAPLRKRASDEYARGFLDAIEMVTAGFERETDHVESVASDVTALRNRKHWVDVLRCIDSGAVVPSAIASKLSIDRGQLTRLLSAMDDAGVIVRTEGNDGDGRTRPCRLTPRARLLLRGIPAPEPVSAPIDQLVDSVVNAMTTLIAGRRTSRASMRLALGIGVDEKAANVVFQRLTLSLSRTGICRVNPDESIVAHALELDSYLDRVMVGALQSGKREFIERVRRVGDGAPLVVRGTSRRQWDVLLADAEGAPIQLVRDDDFLVGGLQIKWPQPYVVLYESPALLFADRYAGREQLLSGAKARAVFGVDAQQNIAGYKTIQLSDFAEAAHA